MKNIKKINYLITLIILIVLLSCKSTEKVTSINENPLNLDNFTFNTNIDTLLPLKNFNGNYYSFDRKYFDHDYLINFSKEKVLIDYKKPIGFEYYQVSSSNLDTLAVFKKNIFNQIHFVTNENNELVVVCAVGKNNKNLLSSLEKRFGDYTKIKSERPKNNKTLYQWETDNYMIRLTSYKNNKDEPEKTGIIITSGTYENENYDIAYLFYIKKNYVENIIHLNSGDLSEID